MKCPACHTPLAAGAAFCPRCGLRQADVEERRDFSYAAFISYRHRSPDPDAAVRIQRAIERYRLPAPVARGYGAARLGHVFRDRDELPATGSLPDAILEALSRSRALVVVRSRATPYQGDVYWRAIAATEEGLIVSNPSSSTVACFDPQTGTAPKRPGPHPKRRGRRPGRGKPGPHWATDGISGRTMKGAGYAGR